jgi:hypothetical protein
MTQFSREVLGPGLIDPVQGGTTAPVLEIHNALGLSWEQADPDYYRKVLLRVTWDDQDHPAVLVPLGDFFGVGHCLPQSYQSALFSVSVKAEETRIFGGSAALNCWAPMPFNKRAVVELVNDSDLPLSHYFYIDYELYKDQLPVDTLYFHARWSRQDPCAGWGPDLQTNSPEVNVPNLTGEGNFVVLETEGRGHYVGCNLAVFHRQGSWWGEGDDMIFIDEDTWPPSIHGTGTEDYFNHAWGMQPNAFQYHGSIIHESDMPGYSVSYRLHAVDPVRFSKRIKVTIEHGHANHLSDDWAATAYWYQSLPSPPAVILPVAERLPNRPAMPVSVQPSEPPEALSDRVTQARRAAQARRQAYSDLLEERTRARAEESDERARLGREQATKIRDSFR